MRHFSLVLLILLSVIVSVAQTAANTQVRQLLLEAEGLASEQKFKAAANKCRAAIALDPDFALSHLMLAENLKASYRDRDEAVTAYKTAVRLMPRYHEILEEAGEYFENKKWYRNAEELYRTALTADPEKMSGRFSLGRMLVSLGRLKEARELWEGRTRGEGDIFPKFETLLLRAERLLAAREAVAKRPKDAAALVELGEAVMDGDGWVVDSRQLKAIVHFRAALRVRPRFVEAQKGIVKAYIQLADSFGSYNRNVDAEMAKLRRLDRGQAEEMKEYRATYKGLITNGPPKEQR